MPKKIQATRRSLLKTVGVGAGVSVGGMGVFSGATQSTSGGTSTTTGPGIIEDFEDGDLTEYTFDYGSSYASVVSSPVYNGEYAMEITGGDAKLVRSESASAPSQGDVFSTQTRVASGTPFALFTYGVQDIDNFYAVRIRFDTDKISVLKQENGTWSELTGKYVNFSFQQSTWYEMEVDWTESGDHALTVSGNGDSATISCTDTTWSIGGIGFIGFVGDSDDRVQFDYTSKTQRRLSGLRIEDFEDGDLSEYTFGQGSNGASVTNANSYTQHQALELSDTDVKMVDPDVSPAPSQGDTVSSRIRVADNDPFAFFNYGVQDTTNLYGVRLRTDIDKVSILKQEAGAWTELTGKYVNFDLKQGVWYELEVAWSTDGDHLLTLSGDGYSTTVSCTDTTWSTGGIGFTHFVDSAGGTAYYDSVQLEPTIGNFETSLDGWSATGSSTLTQRTGTEEPAAVTRDDKTLEVSISSEANPSIECQERVAPANCDATPYLLADVLAADVENSDSNVTFQFRYHHTDPGGVDESSEMTVEQRHGGVLAWDLSELSQSKLESSDRIEISWYPTDHPPSSSFDYNGRVLVDNVRLSSDLNELTQGAYFQKHHELEIAHGLQIDQEIQSQTATIQDGVYKYYNGTEITYQIEKLDDGVFEETVDGDTFRWTEGSA